MPDENHYYDQDQGKWLPLTPLPVPRGIKFEMWIRRLLNRNRKERS